MYIFSIEFKPNDCTYVIFAVDKATCLQLLVERLITSILSVYYKDLNALEKDMNLLTEHINNSECVEINSSDESKFLFEI